MTVKAALQTNNSAYKVFFLRQQSEKVDDYCAIVALKELNKIITNSVKTFTLLLKLLYIKIC